MILNARESSFVLLFPSTFFTKEIVEKYDPYFKSLMLPYAGVSDFMSSTIQSITFPSLDMKLVSQTRTHGKSQEFKNSQPIADLFTREFTINFKLTDAFLNYFIFIENALNYYSFENIEPTNNQKSLGKATHLSNASIKDNQGQYFDPIRLLLMSNEGHIVSSIVFKKPIIAGWSDLKLSYAQNAPEFTTFSVKFNFFEMEFKTEYQ